MASSIRVLICDDSRSVHETLGAYFQTSDIKYSSAYDGEEALEKFSALKPDLVLLDLLMPKKIGTEVCKEIRKVSDVPIIMLSGMGEEVDRIVGLEIGADDYIVKPFSAREVVTRIKTILRRVHHEGKRREGLLDFGDISIDIDRYEAAVQGNPVDLTPKEIQVLYHLAKNKGKVLSREQILTEIWGYDYYGDTRAVDTVIKNIRKKLPESGVNFSIESVYGIGYKFSVL